MDVLQWLADQVDRVIKLLGADVFFFLAMTYAIIVLTAFGL